MTWIDILLIIIWVIFLALGARMGSLWSGACVIGGFIGAALADMYALPASEMIGGFAGSTLLTAIVLFSAGLAVGLIPGYVLSRLSGMLFLNIINSAFGLITGALVGLVAISLIFLLIGPVFPKAVKSNVWKKSILVRPFHAAVETVFNRPQFQPESFTKKIRKETKRKLKPAAEKAAKKVTGAAKEFVDDLK